MTLYVMVVLLPAVVLSATLQERVDEMEIKSLELCTKAKTAKKLTKELRSELISFFLDFVQIHQEVIQEGDPQLLFKVSRIAARLRAGLRVRLPNVKKRLSSLVAGFLTPIVMPWTLFEESQRTASTLPPPPPPPEPTAAAVYYPQQYQLQSYNPWNLPNYVEVDYPYG